MILFLAGTANNARRLKHKQLYEHVLFSKFQYTKKNFAWLKRRIKRERKAK